MIQNLFLMLLLIASSDIVMAQSIYKCTDSNGKISYDSNPCNQSVTTKILNETKPRADAAPLELVVAYKKCVAAIFQQNTSAFYDCFTRQESQLRRARNATALDELELKRNMTVTPLSGSIDKRGGMGNLIVRIVSGASNSDYLSIDFQYETGQWKVATINMAPREKFIDPPPDAKDFKVCPPHDKSC
jgi:hypothetical protein